ncbi:hypothetical protein B0J14DRAFT_646158 [Halenospora varia]|nr:hypothetical protein B0J14DRAFT_646158 [Halenospora varia]
MRQVAQDSQLHKDSRSFEKNAAVFSAGERDWNMGLHWGPPVLLIPWSAVAQLQSVQIDPNIPT